MTLNQKLFVALYCDANSNTFGNGIQSYLKAYPNASYATAMREASRLLRKPHLQKEIECSLQANCPDMEVRFRPLFEILKRPDIGVTVSVNDPETGKQITKSGPKYSDIIKVIEMINRACGLY